MKCGVGIALAVLLVSSLLHADEVDDILALKGRNRERIKRFSAEYTVETKGPKSAKPAVMRYRMKMERMAAKDPKGSLNPFRTEISVLEPYAMNMKVEGERVWMKRNGKW